MLAQANEGLDAHVSSSDLDGLASQNAALRDALESCRAQIGAMAEQARPAAAAPVAAPASSAAHAVMAGASVGSSQPTQGSAVTLHWA